jgi:magnesium transporter
VSLISVFVNQHGETKCLDRVDPQWVDPASAATTWVDFAAMTPEESRLLTDVFHFHPLAVEDALSAVQYPKIETYDGYLYAVLHGIDFRVAEHQLATRDLDFFLGPNYLVTVHDGHSRSIAKLRDICDKHSHILDEGPVALMHRIIDSMVDNYQPEMEKLEERISDMEEEAYVGRNTMVRQLLRIKRDLASMRRVMVPQRDAVGRLARREFTMISMEMAYRFRDVYDHVVRLSDEMIMFQDRVTGILEVNLAAVSNRLNQIMKVLTVASTILLPMTVITGMWGMNVMIPHFPGSERVQFWWVSGIMAALSVVLLAIFRFMDWI